MAYAVLVRIGTIVNYTHNTLDSKRNIYVTSITRALGSYITIQLLIYRVYCVQSIARIKTETNAGSNEPTPP